MPGLFGIISEDAERQIGSMADAMRHREWYRTACVSGPRAAFGVIGHGRLPHEGCADSGNQKLALSGEIFEPEIRGLPALLDRFRDQGLRPEELNGLFQIAYWDDRDQRLSIASDPGGIRPLYYTIADGRFAFASEVKALLALPWVDREIDSEAVLNFLRFGHFVGRQTYFKGIRLMPAGSRGEFLRGSFSDSPYFMPEFSEKSAFDARQPFCDAWLRAIEKQSRGALRFGVLLSGGLDSRMIASGLHNLGLSADTFTFGMESCDDARTSKDIATVLGFDNTFVPVSSENVTEGLPEAVYLSDGRFNCLHSNVRFVLPHLREVEIAFDGIAWTDLFYNSPEVGFRRWLGRYDRERWLRQTFGGIDPRRLGLGRGVVDLLSERFRDVQERDFLAEFAADHPDCAGAIALHDLFEVYQRLHHHTCNGPNLVWVETDVRCPFYDAELLKICAAMDAVYRGEDKIPHRFVLSTTAVQDLKRIPWAKLRLPVTAGNPRVLWQLGWKYLGRVSSRLLPFQIGWTEPPMVDVDAFLREPDGALRRMVQQYLIEEPQSGFFDADSVASLLLRQDAGQSYGEILGRLLTVESWYRQFLQGT